MNRYSVQRLSETSARMRRRLLDDFVKLPRTVYAGDANWVEPLRAEVLRTLDATRNPYFHFAKREILVCYCNEVPVARIVVSNDPTYANAHSGTAFFGYFESLPDSEAAAHLIDGARAVASEWGARELEGPFNPNYYSELGMKLDRFGEPAHFFETYNPPYYPSLLQSTGFALRKTLRTLALQSGLPAAIQQRYGDTRRRVATDGFTVRTLSDRNLPRDLEAIRTIYNDAFADNPYFHSVSGQEYQFSAKYLKYVTKPEFTTIVEDAGEPIAVAQVMQDVNPLLQRMHGSSGPVSLLRYQRGRRSLKEGVVYAIGIRKAYQRSHVMSAVLAGVVPILLRFDRVTTTWTSEDNSDLNSFISRLGFTPDRTFGLYGQTLRQPTRQEVNHAY